MFNDQVKEALKELARVLLLAVIPVAIDALTKESINYGVLAVATAIAVLRALDKWLHEKGKATDNEDMSKGLTRF
jgi:hypothetical protein